MRTIIYFSTIDDDIVNHYIIVQAAMIKDGIKIDINDLDAIRKYAAECSGIREEIENPSVEYLVRHGNPYRAMRLYRETHPEVTFAEARLAIRSLSDDK